MLVGAAEIQAADPSRAYEPFAFQVFPHTDGTWEGGLRVPGFDYDYASVKRSLTSLMIEDTVARLTYAAVPLPHGAGVSFYLEGETFSQVSFHLNRKPQDTLFLNTSKVDGIEQFQLEDSSYLALAVSPEFTDESEIAANTSSLARDLKAGKWQVVLAFDRDPAHARQRAAAYRGMKREQLENAVRDSLAAVAAFALITEDDRTNRAYAVLTAALAGAQPKLSLNNPAEVQRAAACAAGLFLASRARPNVAFEPSSAPNLSQRVRWGAEAYRAALAYGVADDDSLKRVSLDALADVAKLHGEYATNLMALNDETIPDSLMKLAIGHIRYAELLTLCADIAETRGNRPAETNYRKDAANAARDGKKYFAQAKAQFLAVPEMVFDDTEPDSVDASDDVSLVTGKTGSARTRTDALMIGETPTSAPPPDTARFVRAGAHYGFAWLSENPQALMPTTLDGYTWQKWTAYRFARDFKMTQTPDLDSTITLLLEGPSPGMLSENPGIGGAPSLPVMAAAYENLAELYLGFRPNWRVKRVDLEPRPPQTWGHTKARIPYGTGFILLDYDFENDFAAIAMGDIDGRVDVFFGFPLPTGGFVRTQFALSEDEPRVQIRAKRDVENRVKLNVKAAN